MERSRKGKGGGKKHRNAPDFLPGIPLGRPLKKKEKGLEGAVLLSECGGQGEKKGGEKKKETGHVVLET